MVNITQETGKQIGTFMEILRGQPLSLALVAMNILLIVFLFYSGSQTLVQRKETAELVIAWSRETDKLMASCVSADIMKMVLDKFQVVPVFKNYVLDASNAPGQQDRSKLGIEKAIAAYRLALSAVDSWEG